MVATTFAPSAAPDVLPVLVVDDDPLQLQSLRAILELSGFEPLTAATAAEALRIAQQLPAPPPIALVDLGLPDMDGLELVSLLRGMSDETQVVILTGNASLESAVAAMRERSLDYLVKPVALEQLRKTLAMAGERWRRRRAERERRTLQEELEQFFTLSNELICVLGFDGRLQRLNHAFETVLGWSEEDVLGTPWLDLVHPDDRDRARAEEESLRTVDGHMVRGLENRYRHKDGSYRRLLWDVAPLRESQVIYAAGRDITDRQRLEEKLQQLQRMESVGRLAGGVAHDFNNLLTVVLAELDQAGSTLPQGHAAIDSLAEIRKAVERASALTRQLVSFAKQHVVETTVFAVNDRIADLQRMIQRLLAENIRVTVRTPAERLLVRMDQSRLDQVLLNLVLNARDAMPEGGTLEIESAAVELDGALVRQHVEMTPGPYVVIRVRDSGEGMSEEVRARAFEPFFTTKDPGHGTGLGLAMCYGIARQAGGNVEIESARGAGTSVVVYLPRAIEREPPANVSHADGDPGGHEVVLLVEDDDRVRFAMRRMLASLGYAVLEAASGEAALELLARHPGRVDLLLTDVILRGMSGRAVAAAVKATRPEIAVLYASGYAADVTSRGTTAGERVAIITKPFSAKVLGEKVREVLDGQPRRH